MSAEEVAFLKKALSDKDQEIARLRSELESERRYKQDILACLQRLDTSQGNIIGMIHTGFRNLTPSVACLIYEPRSTTSVAQIMKGYAGPVEVPEGVTKICPSAFYHSEIYSIILPDSLEVLGEAAFCNCKILRGEIVIPPKVTKITASLFYGCSSLDTIVIHENVQSYEANSFINCPAKVVGPQSVLDRLRINERVIFEPNDTGY